MEWLPDAARLDYDIHARSRDSAPTRLILDAAGAREARMVMYGYREANRIPHLTIDLDGQRVYQHLGFDQVAPLEGSVREYGIWVMLCKQLDQDLTRGEAELVAELLGPVVMAFGLGRDYLECRAPAGVGPRLSPNQLRAFAGVCGVQHLPGHTGLGPGLLDLAPLFASWAVPAELDVHFEPDEALIFEEE